MYFFQGIPASAQRESAPGPTTPVSGNPISTDDSSAASPTPNPPSTPASGGGPDNLFELAQRYSANSGTGTGTGTSGTSPGATGGGGDTSGVLASLRSSPQFNQIRDMIASNPQLLQPLLQQLGASNPQLFQVRNPF